MVENLPANSGDTRNASLVPGQEDFLEMETATHSSILREIRWDAVEAWQATVHGDTKSQTRLNTHRDGQGKSLQNRHVSSEGQCSSFQLPAHTKVTFIPSLEKCVFT